MLLVAALSADRRPSPVFQSPVPIRKTRAGLQFTCAAPTLGLNAYNMRDVWVCNSDGYVGQVCVLSLQPEPTVISCNGVCNARILCIASIPAGITGWGYWNDSYVRSVVARLYHTVAAYWHCFCEQKSESMVLEMSGLWEVNDRQILKWIWNKFLSLCLWKGKKVFSMLWCFYQQLSS